MSERESSAIQIPRASGSRTEQRIGNKIVVTEHPSRHASAPGAKPKRVRKAPTPKADEAPKVDEAGPDALDDDAGGAEAGADGDGEPTGDETLDLDLD